MSTLVEVEYRNELACLTLNRPQRHNALVPELLQALIDAIATVHEANPAGLIVRGAGPSFSTGGDLTAFVANDAALPAYAHDLVGLLNDSILALLAFPAPTAAHVHGWATGGSLGLLLAVDRVAASSDARVAPYYREVGFAPDGGWTALLPARIGAARVAALLHDNEVLDARALMDLGLVHAIDQSAEELLRPLLDQPPGFATTTRMLLAGGIGAVRDALERERHAFVEQIRRPQTRAALRHFIERSMP